MLYYCITLSKEDVLSLIAPPRDEVEPVLQWLSKYDVVFSEMGDYIKAQASVAQVEVMFSTKMYVYQHDNGNKQVCNHGSAYIPEHLHDIITLVSGLTEFPHFKKLHTKVGATDPGVITPPLLQTLYGTPTEYPTHSNSSLCVVEFMDDASYSREDLKQFSQEMNVPLFSPQHVGPFNPSNPDAESTLDVQYGGSVVLNTSFVFWTVKGWMMDFAQDLFSANQPPLVVSMSWGWPEPDQCEQGVGSCTNNETSAEYVARCNNEYLKIVARGITLVAASGDQGAPGDDNPGCNTSGKNLLSNLFPASSPWVTAVGATMLISSNNSIEYPLPPICSNMTCATNGTEEVCTYPEALITSGGGFSTYSTLPEWQSADVISYLKSNVSLPPIKFYNQSNRAYPDISALGHNYIIQWGGMPIQVDGTSCSSPTVAAMFALLNSARLNAGRPPLGFINPLLYSAFANNSAIFNDFTTGNNKCTENCCSRYGFEATPGWDPVTGLGSPNFPALLQYVKDLPR